LRKLTAGQYLAELVLHQALSHQPQEDLFALLNEQLRWLEQLPASAILPYLSYAMFRLLALAGVAPQVHDCCITQQPILPNFSDPNWQAGFHPALGGVVTIGALERLKAHPSSLDSPTQAVDYGQTVSHFQDLAENGEKKVKAIASFPIASNGSRADSIAPVQAQPLAPLASETSSRYRVKPSRQNLSELGVPITAMELAVLQQLPEANLIQPDGSLPWSLTLEKGLPFDVWVCVERILRRYAQYHFDRSIQSAALVDTCFSVSSSPSPVT
jgi:DNA repair protein RecO (recombination protein O)